MTAYPILWRYSVPAEAAQIPDGKQNMKIAALDSDDNGDDINDGLQIDSDGDGIPDYLEYYGFTYNWMTVKYVAWDGDYSKVYYKTDPHQKSTDQDPFDDNVEVTGVNMDVSVAAPGNLPMVPAYPDIVVSLEGYSVTLNQQITWTEGSSFAKGTTWERTSPDHTVCLLRPDNGRGQCRGERLQRHQNSGVRGQERGFPADDGRSARFIVLRLHSLTGHCELSERLPV